MSLTDRNPMANCPSLAPLTRRLGLRVPLTSWRQELLSKLDLRAMRTFNRSPRLAVGGGRRDDELIPTDYLLSAKIITQAECILPREAPAWDPKKGHTREYFRCLAGCWLRRRGRQNFERPRKRDPEQRRSTQVGTSIKFESRFPVFSFRKCWLFLFVQQASLQH